MTAVYRKHPNGGGFVAITAFVADSVHVGPLCIVEGAAHLSGTVTLTGRARVGGTTVATAGTFAGRSHITHGNYHKECIIIEVQKD